LSLNYIQKRDIKLAFKLAFKYFKSLRNSILKLNFILSILGIIIGSSALIISQAVIQGFESVLLEKLIRGNGDLVFLLDISYKDIPKYEALLKLEENIKAVCPYVYYPVMIRYSKFNTYSAAILRGVDPEKEVLVTNFDKNIKLGSWESLNKVGYGIFGKSLAENLGLYLNDTVQVISPIGKKTPFGYIPKIGYLKVGGIFSLGLYQFDNNFILVSLETLQKIFGVKKINGFLIKVKNFSKLEETKIRLQLKFPEAQVQSWIEINKSLFSTLKLEKLAMFFVTALILVVASFNIMSFLANNIFLRARDIAILKTLGTSNLALRYMFLFQGIFISILGILIGNILGVGISYIFDKYKLIKLPAQSYFVDYLPFKVEFSNLIWINTITFLICLISSKLALKRLSELSITDILRNYK